MNLIEKGLIAEKEALLFLQSIPSFAEEVAGFLSELSCSRIITKQSIVSNIEKVDNLLRRMMEDAEEEERMQIEKALYLLFSMKEKKEEKEEEKEKKELEICSKMQERKKISVKDFVSCFRDRFERTRAILQEKVEDVISIGKIGREKGNVNIIGIVSEKRTTKNNNIMLELEDMTGKIRAVISRNKRELFEIAREIVEDEVLALECSGNREILFVNNIIFPDIAGTKKRAEGRAAFIADLHVGSKKFLEKNFLDFLEWLNSQQIRYLFVLGDIIDGIGVYPRQEGELEIKDVTKQFEKAAELFSKVREDIKIVFLPGNHDALRVAEPQPKLDEKLAFPLYKLQNAIFVSNPCTLKIEEMKMLLYHGFSFDYYMNDVDKLRMSGANEKPELIMNFLLRKRNLAPSYSSTQYFPCENDAFFIENIDVFASAHLHKSGTSMYNNIITISCSCFQSRTEFQERCGHEPDPCKVPVLDMKTGRVRIYDFS